MNKRLLALLIAAIMLLSLTACGGGDKDTSIIKCGDCTAEYTGAKIMKDYDGDDTIAVYFDFTNDSDETTSFAWTVLYAIEQDGESLDFSTVFVSEDSYDTLSDAYLEDVEPGDTEEVVLTHKLNDTDNDVKLTFMDINGKNKGSLTIELDDIETVDGDKKASDDDDEEEEVEEEEDVDTSDDEEEADDKKTSGTASSKFGGSSKDDKEEVEEEPEFDSEFAALYGGDWHGVCEYYDSTGTREELNGSQCDILARFVFHEDGSCTPYIRLAIVETEDYNLQDLVVTYNEEYECMDLSGQLAKEDFGGESSFVEISGDDVLYIGISNAEETDEDIFNILACLRRLDDQWDYENDYPYLVQDAVNFYDGKSFEDRVVLFDCDVDLIPDMDAAPASSGSSDDDDTADTGAASGGESGEAIVAKDVLKDFLAWRKEIGSYENQYYKPTLDEMLEQLGGVEGEEYALDRSWNETQQCYRWMSPEGEHIIMIVRLADDGEWRFHSVSWSGGLN